MYNAYFYFTSFTFFSDLLSKEWSLRASTWKRYIFYRSDLPKDAKAFKNLVKQVPLRHASEAMAEEVPTDAFGPLLLVKRLTPRFD